jgi:phosphohistidine swiveling domain-containing protein
MSEPNERTRSTSDELVWTAPTKGDWRGLHDHFPRALTPENEAILRDGMVVGEAVWIGDYGFPVRSMEPRFVHGRVFISPQPLVGPRSDRVPPGWAMKLALRLVPAFRRAVRAAEAAVAERPWRAEAARWFAVERDEWLARDAALAAIDPGSLDDAALAAHLAEARALVVDGYRTHFRLHGCDLIPTGMLLRRAIDWGLDPVEVAGLLAGWSPVSRGDEAPPAWSLVTGYDLDDKAACELPARPAPSREPKPPDPEVERRIRDDVPAADRDEFDRLLLDARETYGVRDSNGLLTAAWPMGLLRRAMLEAGRRLAARGALPDAEHAVELTAAELGAALLGRSAPSSADVAARRAERRRLSAVPAPAQLGTVAELPVEAMPPGMRTLTRALLAVRDLGITVVDGRPPLEGVAIGRESAVGRACVALDPAEAFERFEPGDIVVTAGTCPAWNQVLALAGGVITEEGGPLSHAAVIARELGLPALIGCAEAMAHIPDGATIELDAAAATVRIL